MAPLAQQTPKHVFRALRDRRLRPSEQNGVIARYLRWRSVNAEIQVVASVHRSRHSTLAVAALIATAPTSTSEHGALSDPATSECERTVIHQRTRDGFRTPRTQISGNCATVFGSAPFGATLISLAASARRWHVLAPPSTSLASLDRFSLGVTSVAIEKIVLLLLLMMMMMMQLHTTQLRPQRRRSRRSRQHAEAAEAAIR